MDPNVDMVTDMEDRAVTVILTDTEDMDLTERIRFPQRSTFKKWR